MAFLKLKQAFKKYFRVGKVNKANWTPNRVALILRKTKGHCYLCGAELMRNKKALHVFRFSVEHLVPISKGGRHGRGNVVATCWHCNGLKASMTIEELQQAYNRRKFRERKLETLNRVRIKLMTYDPASADLAKIEALWQEWKHNYQGSYWFELNPDKVKIPRDLTGFEVFKKDLRFAMKRLVKRIRPQSLVNRAATNSHRIAHVHPQRPHQQPGRLGASGQAANDLAD